MSQRQIFAALNCRDTHYRGDTNKCLNDIKNKVMTQRNAAKAYNIPRRTINYKLKEKHIKSFDRPNAFSEAKEKKKSGSYSRKAENIIRNSMLSSLIFKRRMTV
jgi:hypothetical protein